MKKMLLAALVGVMLIKVCFALIYDEIIEDPICVQNCLDSGYPYKLCKKMCTYQN